MLSMPMPSQIFRIGKPSSLKKIAKAIILPYEYVGCSINSKN